MGANAHRHSDTQTCDMYTHTQTHTNLQRHTDTISSNKKAYVIYNIVVKLYVEKNTATIFARE